MFHSLRFGGPIAAVLMLMLPVSAGAQVSYTPNEIQALVSGKMLDQADQSNPEKQAGAARRFRTLVASPFKDQLQPVELQLLSDPKTIDASRRDLDDRLDQTALRRKLIAAGVLEVETASAGARALREAALLFRQRIGSQAVGDLTEAEVQKLIQIEAAVDNFAAFKKIEYSDSERTLVVPSRLVSPLPDPESINKAWVTFSSSDPAKRIRVHLVLHPAMADTAVSLAASLISSSTREANSKTQFDYMQLTRDDFLVKMRTSGSTNYLNHTAGWERNAKVFAIKFTANLDNPPALDLPAVLPPDDTSANGADPTDAKKRQWLQLVRILWNLIITELKPQNGWQSLDATECRGRSTSDGKAIAIIYGTDRKPLQPLSSASRIDADGIYSTERENALHVGCAIVWVPKSAHNTANIRSLIARGAAGLPTNSPAQHFDVVAHELAEPLKPDDDREFVLHDRLKFRSERALLFVHGYNSSFADAILRAAQIAAATNYTGRVFVFSWPSQENPVKYISDMDNAEQAEISLQAFLKMIFRDPSGLKVDVMAHSMGAQILMRSLGNLSGTFDRREGSAQYDRIRLGQVIFAAPDVSELVFRSRLPLIRKYSDRITVYSSGNDGPLKLSSWLRGTIPRAGLISKGRPSLFKGVDMIDITGTSRHWLNPKQYFGYYHSAFSYEAAVLQDIQAVLTPHKKSMDPMARAAAAKLPNKFKEETGSGIKYWVLKAPE